MGCLGSLIQTYLSEMTDSLNLKNNHRPHCDALQYNTIQFILLRLQRTIEK